MEENAIVVEKKPNLFLAILAAIGMGLIGCVAWGLLYYWGVIAWVAAFLVVFLAGWAYRKVYKKLDTKGYIIITFIAVIEIILTLFISLNLAVLAELNWEYNFFECFGLIFQVLGASPEVMTALIIDIVLSLVMIVGGTLVLFFSERSKAKRAAEEKEKIESAAKVENAETKTETEVVIKDTTQEENKKEE